MVPITRPNVQEAYVDAAVRAAGDKLSRRLRQKGRGTYASRLEVLGALTEEYHELTEAMISAPISGTKHSVREELLDIAVGCLFGIACIDAGYIYDKAEPPLEVEGNAI